MRKVKIAQAVRRRGVHVFQVVNVARTLSEFQGFELPGCVRTPRFLNKVLKPWALFMFG